MSNLITTSKSFLEWAQSLPHVVIPAGLESDMQEAIAEAERLLACADAAASHGMPEVAKWYSDKAAEQNAHLTPLTVQANVVCPECETLFAVEVSKNAAQVA